MLLPAGKSRTVATITALISDQAMPSRPGMITRTPTSCVRSAAATKTANGRSSRGAAPGSCGRIAARMPPAIMTPRT